MDKSLLASVITGVFMILSAVVATVVQHALTRNTPHRQAEPTESVNSQNQRRRWFILGIVAVVIIAPLLYLSISLPDTGTTSQGTVTPSLNAPSGISTATSAGTTTEHTVTPAATETHVATPTISPTQTQTPGTANPPSNTSSQPNATATPTVRVGSTPVAPANQTPTAVPAATQTPHSVAIPSPTPAPKETTTTAPTPAR